tara:strand:+ start:482 stop:598 length:117 start_codon:yes stop_codon:yes gene_type:complete
MGNVPWAKCVYHTGKITLVNLSFVENVTLEKPKEKYEI